MVAASVGSWKTEQVGFEVGGRVEFVVERNTEVSGQIFDSEGARVFSGTPIARIENERYKLNVALAEAELARAQQELAVANTNLRETIPAQIEAATARKVLAAAEYGRQERLFNSNAGSKGDLDVALADLNTAEAQVREANASELAKGAEIKSLEASVSKAEQSVRDAKRDLEDCTLYSSFRGLIAETAVVPGSVVTAGQAVATLQMMDPIKVELEVSADQSRRLRRTEIFPVHVTMPDGQTEIHDGYLYRIDSIADPSTRTFTLTLLLINPKLRASTNPDDATTSEIWRLDLPFVQGDDSEALFVVENAILTDKIGPYLWQITNATIQNRSLEREVFTVRKLRIDKGERRVPYFGDFVFQEVIVSDPEFDPKVNLVTGEIQVGNGVPNEWEGEEVTLDSGVRWMLRPGDLVKVDLSDNSITEGYYVPSDAIARKDGEAAIFVIESAGEQTVAKRIPIMFTDTEAKSTTASLRRVVPMGDVPLEGLQYVVKGAHYLIDGESVTVVSAGESDQ